MTYILLDFKGLSKFGHESKNTPFRYVAWEKNNPMRSDDNSLIKKRVMYAYEQALLTWGHHPDIWYEAALFLERSANLVHEKGDTQVLL